MDIEVLKQKILDLAIRGKLVPQDPSDEPASVLIEKIKAEKAKLIKEGKIKASKDDSYIYKGSDNCYYEKDIRLGDAITYIQPTNYIVKLTNYDNKFKTPVLTPGKTFILGYTNELDGIYDATEKNVIIFDDFTTANKFVDFKFKVKSSAMKILISSSSERYDIKYFYYLLQTLKPQVDTHKRFWISEYAPLVIAVPPIWYQKLVVDYLDVLYHHINQIESEKEKISNYIEYAKHKILEDIFGENSSYKSYYKIKQGELMNYCASITKGTTPTSYGFKYLNRGIPFIKVENVSNYCVNHNTINCYISKEANEFQKRSQLKENDILFSIAGTIGKICLIKKCDVPSNTNQAFAIISGYSNHILPEYLMYYLEWSKFSDSKVDTHGLGMENATLTGLKKLKIWFPELLSDQQIIVKELINTLKILNSIAS